MKIEKGSGNMYGNAESNFLDFSEGETTPRDGPKCASFGMWTDLTQG